MALVLGPEEGVKENLSLSRELKQIFFLVEIIAIRGTDPDTARFGVLV